MFISPRLNQILRILLGKSQPVSVDALAQATGVSRRTVFRELDHVDQVLQKTGLRLDTVPGEGMSTYKLLKQGAAHKRCPKDVAEHPVPDGHELSGDIVKVGRRWQGEFRPGEKFALQPALNYRGRLDSPGYSYRWCGGAASYCIMSFATMVPP